MAYADVNIWVSVQYTAKNQRGNSNRFLRCEACQEIEIKVDEKMVAQIDSRPLVSTRTRLVVGISLLFGLFGLS